MKTYKIIGKTNGYIANRDIHFNGKTEIPIATGLTLDQARKELDKLFIKDYDNSHDIVFGDEGEILNQVDERWTDYNDGTASYEYDSRYYRILEEED